MTQQTEFTHAYDDQTLGPREFLLAVMHDATVPRPERMDAAKLLVQLWSHIYNDAAPAFAYRIPDIPKLMQ